LRAQKRAQGLLPTGLQAGLSGAFMKKVAFLLDRLGNRRHHFQFKILKKHGFTPYALIFEEYLKDVEFPPGIANEAKLHPLPFKRNEVLRKFNLSFLKYLIKFLKKEGITILLTHRWRFLRYAIFSKFFYPELRIIYYIVVGGTLKHPGRRLFFRLFKGKIDLILINSLALKEEILSTGLVKPEEVELLYSSFDLKAFPENFLKHLLERPFLFLKRLSFLGWLLNLDQKRGMLT
jgi:hypothetical protein